MTRTEWTATWRASRALAADKWSPFGGDAERAAREAVDAARRRHNDGRDYQDGGRGLPAYHLNRAAELRRRGDLYEARSAVRDAERARRELPHLRACAPVRGQTPALAGTGRDRHLADRR